MIHQQLFKHKKTQHNRWDLELTLTLHTVCPCSLTCSQLEITCSICVRSKKSSCSSSGMSWLNSMVSSTLSNFLRTERGWKRRYITLAADCAAKDGRWNIHLGQIILNVVQTFRNCIKMQKTTDWSGFILYAWFPMSLNKTINKFFQLDWEQKKKLSFLM